MRTDLGEDPLLGQILQLIEHLLALEMDALHYVGVSRFQVAVEREQ